ncbi:peptidoglycan/LPS O-acetylase OafA/YrhL [Acinetobacter sp. BIGb0102]|uniref:acyltransferase family protein n=1 Tax=Acinetobacter sp. BIGb0102 TaxID=2485131 RepID=UPI000FB37CAB|nr:acyltransferase family protein [Acinetobacter sp. BIGb0102]RPE26544.1 peptidoglycan/LPS O-acetylase OafA/YrhL [Acinetobacter sp. BIGb0102]
MNFRKDINGLRAIAVIAVVIFHFYPSLLTGGFAGVDVFFVISGFLMTGIIFKGLENNNFSLIKFYIARANRIIPPLFILCLALLTLGWFFLAPWDYKTVGRDVATSMLFISNIMFSMRGGYFDTGDNFLLHTWSLSAEWQFYILYPIVLLIFKRLFSLSILKRIILIFFFISLFISIYATQIWPDQSYFLLPTRAWEMILGGLAFLYPLKLEERKKIISGKTLELLGVSLIVLSYIFISEHNLWPGYLALFPTIGTWLIIQAQRQNSLITNNIIFQKIGLWSYSIYLWHWPIAASYSYFGIDNKYKLFGILISLILGYLSYLIIEKRKFNSPSIAKSIFIYTIIILTPVLIGLYLFKSQGMIQRQSLVANSLIHGGTGNNFIVKEGISLLNTTKDYNYLLLGDSHSNHYTRGINLYKTKVKISWYATCLSLPDSINVREGNYKDWKDNCKNNYKLGLLENKKIIIAQSWERPLTGSLECTTPNCHLTGNYHEDLKSQLDKLLTLYGENKDIYIVGAVPKPKDKSIPICLKSKLLTGIDRNCTTISEPSDESNTINKILLSIVSKHKNVHFINIKNTICQNNNCNYSVNGKSIFMSDGSHLSGYGSELFWKYIIHEIENKKD